MLGTKIKVCGNTGFYFSFANNTPPIMKGGYYIMGTILLIIIAVAAVGLYIDGRK